MTETYTLYIDESGDEGIDRDNQFQSPLFFLGAVLVQDKEIKFVKDSIFNLEISLGKKLHFSSMTHEQKVCACKKIVTLPITLFGHISDKSGLDIGGYRATIEGQKGKFYNKNVHYLLEIVTSYCEENNIVLSKVFFDKIETKNYNQLKNYLYKIAKNPFNPKAKILAKFNPDNIFALSSEESPLLKISDAVANSLYRSCVKNKFGDTEHRYVSEMKIKFFRNKDGIISNFGVQTAPRGFRCLNINIDYSFVQNMEIPINDNITDDLNKIKAT